MFINFLKCGSFAVMFFQWRDINLSGFIKTIFIYVSENNKSYLTQGI